MSDQTYFAADTPFQAERERLGILERLFDDPTQELLARLGVSKGWECCEIGAGGGSITRWLAQKVGPSGRVVAVDLNTRFLTELDLANVEVIEADFLSDSPIVGAFDLVFTRFLLCHLEDPVAAIRRMAELAKPNGWVAAIDLDVTILSAADPDHPHSSRFNEARSKVNEYDRAGYAPSRLMGRRLPKMFEDAGLVEVTNSAWGSVTSGGSLQSEFWRRSWEIRRPALLGARALPAEEYDVLLTAMADPTFRFLDGLWFKVVGRSRAYR